MLLCCFVRKGGRRPGERENDSARGMPGMGKREERSKNFNIELREVTFGTHLRKHLRLLVGYCETSVTGGHARLDYNVNSESKWSLEASVPQDFSVIETLQNEKYITKSSNYSTYDFYPTGRFFHYNRNLNYSAAIITIISTSKGVNYFV